MAGVIVQTVCTRWTKLSRGAPHAARRNATPGFVLLDPFRIRDAAAVWHEVTFDEPDFQLRETYRERSLPNDFDRAAVQLESNGELSVRVFGSTRLRLKPGQLGRIRYNLSDDVMTDGWYRTVFLQVVFAVAFHLQPEPDLFRRAPDQEFVSMRDLT